MASRTVLIKRYVRSVRVTEISLTSIHEEQIDLSDDEHEPTNMIDAKCNQLVDILGCTYEEAERLILSHQ